MKPAILASLVVLAFTCTVHLLRAQSTAWNYQGHLTDGGTGANGLFDMTFGLFTAAVDGTAVSTVTNTSVSVSDGLFTTALEFGPVLLDGTDYWLAIAVRPAGGGGFTLVNPRQPLRPTPYALVARRVVGPRVSPLVNMVLIQPGSFAMGSHTNEVDRDSDEGPQTTVIVSRGFWVGAYEVTQREYQNVIGSNPSSFTGDLDRPVERVSWIDATNYCARLTSRERSAGRIPSSYVYRLPTEAEWEYACRAGTSTRFSHGNDPGYEELGNFAWHFGNSASTTHPVGRKGANPWGLYDMHGNVSEWCQDRDGSYPGGVVNDPTGPASGLLSVSRGGSWLTVDRACRSAFRNGLRRSNVSSQQGFRVVLAPVE